MDQSTDVFQLVGDRIKERSENRVQAAENRRAKHQVNASEDESLDIFYNNFTEMKDDLKTKIIQISKSSVDEAQSIISDLTADLQNLQEYLNSSLLFLPAFQKKKSQEYIDQLDDDIKCLSNSLQPKKKFGFRAKKLVAPTKQSTNETEIPKNEEERKGIVLSNFLGFKDEVGKTLSMEACEFKNRQLTLQNLTDCKVIALGNPGSIQIANLKKCVIILGPTTRSAFIKDCSDCKVVLACQQVRIHNTTDSDFYLHVTGAAIIEDCHKLQFSCYNLKYDKLDQDFEDSGLSTKINNWQHIDDFSWLNEKESSPNFSFIEAPNAISSWF